MGMQKASTRRQATGSPQHPRRRQLRGPQSPDRVTKTPRPTPAHRVPVSLGTKHRPQPTAVRPRPGSCTSATVSSPVKPRDPDLYPVTQAPPLAQRPRDLTPQRTRHSQTQQLQLRGQRGRRETSTAPPLEPLPPPRDTTSPIPRPHPARPALHPRLTNAYSGERARVREDAQRPREALCGPKRWRQPPGTGTLRLAAWPRLLLLSRARPPSFPNGQTRPRPTSAAGVRSRTCAVRTKRTGSSF
ncbi:serine/arginine repetitive matrix protein 1-like [Panthera pardus]|uniref:Serine/arginine repetitive matrix protein 1-like n=1 Tax=Panthera pardus TaxID=9691 RepID=A0A9W2V0B0_PANPR|nr:serine/arginine repetitive matrix protein 1-like [Panthera pardus]